MKAVGRSEVVVSDTKKFEKYGTASERRCLLGFLASRSRLNAGTPNQDEDDLLEQKRSLQEGIFASM